MYKKKMFSEQNGSLFKFVVETKSFEAWAYCLQTNLVF